MIGPQQRKVKLFEQKAPLEESKEIDTSVILAAAEDHLFRHSDHVTAIKLLTSPEKLFKKDDLVMAYTFLAYAHAQAIDFTHDNETLRQHKLAALRYCQHASNQMTTLPAKARQLISYVKLLVTECNPYPDKIRLVDLDRNIKDFEVDEKIVVGLTCFEQARIYVLLHAHTQRAIKLLYLCEKAFTEDELARTYAHLAFAYLQESIRYQMIDDDGTAESYRAFALNYSALAVRTLATKENSLYFLPINAANDIYKKSAIAFCGLAIKEVNPKDDTTEIRQVIALALYVQAKTQYVAEEFTEAVETLKFALRLYVKMKAVDGTWARIRLLYALTIAELPTPPIDPMLVLREMDETYWKFVDTQKNFEAALYYESSGDCALKLLNDKKYALERYQKAFEIVKNCEGNHVVRLEWLRNKIVRVAELDTAEHEIEITATEETLDEWEWVPTLNLAEIACEFADDQSDTETRAMEKGFQTDARLTDKSFKTEDWLTEEEEKEETDKQIQEWQKLQLSNAQEQKQIQQDDAKAGVDTWIDSLKYSLFSTQASQESILAIKKYPKNSYGCMEYSLWWPEMALAKYKPIIKEQNASDQTNNETREIKKLNFQ